MQETGDRLIQRQNSGLHCNAIDHADGVHNVARMFHQLCEMIAQDFD